MPRKILLLQLLLLLLVLSGAAGFRFARLDLRPMHGDEANQAVKAGHLLERGTYAYDPHEHHGPTLYYAMLPVFRACGVDRFADTTEVMYRVLPAFFGLATVVTLLALWPGLGGWTVFWAMLLTAISNPMVYYSRYFVQEPLFVFFALGVVVCGWWYWRTGRLAFALLTGAFLGLTHATKETCVVLYAAMAGALLLAWAWGRWRDDGAERQGFRPRPGHVVAGLGIAAAMSVTLYSSFFAHPRGVLDSVLTYATYLGRAEGAGSVSLHDKPWYYYLGLLAYSHREAGPRWSEAVPLLLGVVGMVAALRRRNTADAGLLRFLAFYTLLTTLAYSLIPYKTPWNLLPFWQPWLVLAGVGVMAGLRSMRWAPAQTWFVCLLAFFLWQLSDQAWRSSFQYPADVRNPYVYAHTTTAIRRLTGRLDDLATISPKGRDLRINVISPTADYWPLPWYLRTFNAVGYYSSALPEPADADVIIASPETQGRLPGALKHDYFREMGALRPNALLHVYIDRGLWDAFMETRR